MMDNYFEKSFRFWIAGTRGGATRARILQRLLKGPKNCHELSKELGMDYSTIEHHLERMRKEGMVSTIEEKQYGRQYHISFTPEELEIVKKVLVDLGKST